MTHTDLECCLENQESVHPNYDRKREERVLLLPKEAPKGKCTQKRSSLFLPQQSTCKTTHTDLECCLENQESVHLNFIVPFILKLLNWHIFFRSRFFSIEDNFGKNFFYQKMCSVLAFWGTCPFLYLVLVSTRCFL